MSRDLKTVSSEGDLKKTLTLMTTVVQRVFDGRCGCGQGRMVGVVLLSFAALQDVFIDVRLTVTASVSCRSAAISTPPSVVAVLVVAVVATFIVRTATPFVLIRTAII